MSRSRDIANIGDDVASGTVLTSSGAIDVNASAPADSLAIDASGNVGIGTTSPLDKLDVVSTGDNFSRIRSTSGSNAATLYFQNSDTGTTSGDGTYIGITGAEEAIVWNTENTDMRFGTNNTERMRIYASGDVEFGSFSDTGASDGHRYINDAYPRIDSSTDNTGGVGHYRFFNPNGRVGQILTSGSATTYSTSSDYRLKENVVDMTGAITRVKSLSPKRFNFIADPDKTVDGFLAHEAQEIVPEAVTGEKDAVDAEGNPEYQGIDQAKLVPLLTAALQEAIAKIETLEARVDALENA